MKCDLLRGSIFGILYLYLSYRHMTSVSNGCLGGSNCCVMVEFLVYWFQSHSNLVLEMVIRWLPLFVYISALSCMI